MPRLKFLLHKILPQCSSNICLPIRHASKIAMLMAMSINTISPFLLSPGVQAIYVQPSGFGLTTEAQRWTFKECWVNISPVLYLNTWVMSIPLLGGLKEAKIIQSDRNRQHHKHPLLLPYGHLSNAHMSSNNCTIHQNPRVESYAGPCKSSISVLPCCSNNIHLHSRHIPGLWARAG